MSISPSVWPPPSWAPKKNISGWWQKIPILKKIISHIKLRSDYKSYIDCEICPIIEDISRKILNRPKENKDLTKTEQDVIEIISNIVREERSLNCKPHIYTSDEIKILCFGLENLTILRFILTFEKQYKCIIDRNKIDNLLKKEEPTVQGLLYICISSLGVNQKE